MNYSQRLAAVRSKYRAVDSYQCLPDIIQEMERLTRATCWKKADYARGVLLYGAGSFGAGAIEYLHDQGIKVIGFLDDTPGKEGSDYCGLRVARFSLAEHSDHPIIMTLNNWASPAGRLLESKVSCESFANFVFRTNLKQLITIGEQMLSDDRSRAVYLTILKANILGDDTLYPTIYEGNQYWAIPEFQYLADSKGVMVDAGAYVGETMEEFVWRSHGVFDRIHAFEPHPQLYTALLRRSSRLKEEWALQDDAINCVQAGLGDREADIPFFEHNIGNMAGSFLFSHGEERSSLTVNTLDGVLGGSSLTFLKADVEGFEVPLIRGAKLSISVNRPMIAMSLYHRITDLLVIPTLLKSMVPEYRMSVRHHSLNQSESVLYCYV